MAKQTFLERNWCSELVSVVRSNNGRRESVQGNLEEIAERSALVLAEAALSAGSRVEITSNSHVLKGIVKSCTLQTGLGFLLEVRLAPESYWSRTGFVPQHLLTFRQPLLRLSA
jgi:hypothetical protein